ncbi:MAG: GGDEF domain-containing protein, partial [Desulfuromonas sp.]
MLARKNNLMLLLGTVLVCAFLVTSLASYYVSRTSLRAQINTGELPLTSDNIYSEIQQ